MDKICVVVVDEGLKPLLRLPRMLDPKVLSPEQRELLVNCIHWFSYYINDEVDAPVKAAVGMSPTKLAITLSELNSLIDALRPPPQLEMPSQTRAREAQTEPLPESLLRILKRAVIYYRRTEGTSILNQVRQTVDPDLRQSVRRQLDLLNSLMESDWFRRTTAAPLPRATDYVTTQAVRPHLRQPKASAREYDQKFGILLSAGLFHSDLKVSRSDCELRGCPVSIAYMDIDHFKDFNSKHGEPAVDRDILPKFMATLDSQLYYRGMGYRIGGDEYVAIFPNSTALDAVQTMHRFQDALREIDYGPLLRGSANPTVSIGVVELDRDSQVSEDDAESQAARAKKRAKEAGRDLVATYGMSAPHQEEAIEIYASPKRPKSQ